MTDRELLELAAKAAGRCIVDWIGDGNWVSVAVLDDGSRWQPLLENQFTDCVGDALRLAVKLGVSLNGFEIALSYGRQMAGVDCREDCIVEWDGDPYAAACRAIVRAAAEIGKAMP